jgi:hypothetical protein
VSGTEFTFLALGLVLGIAVGAAVAVILRARPAPRREVRVTVRRDAIAPRPSVTLASADPHARHFASPGGPGGDPWGPPSPGTSSPPSGGPPIRTSVPSRVAETTAAAEGLRVATMTAVLDPPAPGVLLATASRPRPAVGAPGGRLADRVVRPRAVGLSGQVHLASDAVGIPIVADLEPGRSNDPLGLGRDSVAPSANLPGVERASREPRSTPAASEPAGCEEERRALEERCAEAASAEARAREAADALHRARRARDELEARLERVRSTSDPHRLREAKEGAHQAFRLARAAATSREEAEGAARRWLAAINDLNAEARDAARELERLGAAAVSSASELERLSAEADATRIHSEVARDTCAVARSALARCEEAAAPRSVTAGPADGEAQAARGTEAAPDGWPSAADGAVDPGPDRYPAIIAILRGSDAVREQIAATMASDEGAEPAAWRARIGRLVDAIVRRAIEDGQLTLPESHPFWGMFSLEEQREVVAALSSLGYRFDGEGGFADGRVPGARDLSLAVGYAGLDRMRVRKWPRDEELAGLLSGAGVAADEWLAGQTSDLELVEMIDALGPRAGDLADVWNAWGRLRPLLLQPA